jgi:hypothetical protein
MGGRQEREVLLELMQIGNAVKVVAVDPVTGTEVSIVGSPSDGEDVLKRNAINKLNYVLRKAKGNLPPGGNGPGTLV